MALLLPTAKLDMQELDTLEGLLKEDPASRVLKSPRAPAILPKSLSKPFTFLPAVPASSPKLSLDKENIDLFDGLVHAPALCAQPKNKQKDLPTSSTPSSPPASATRKCKVEKEPGLVSPSLSYTSDNSLVGAALSDWSGTSNDGYYVHFHSIIFMLTASVHVKLKTRRTHCMLKFYTKAPRTPDDLALD
ncbi:unnamed protein product [Dibothriocephalus latus]|uniref:Uncharacterized protein n=1 Tax=Dibothriocephalus latus TaxID=60516 RepID=A0A3P7NHK2_DIBLA|nr:unnamed protein product [Dibothriocephalus latus]